MQSDFLKYLSIPFSKPLYDGLVGSYQTKVKGQGTDYDSSRPYDTSDHPKYIDRKTSAKKDTLYSKQYHDEQQLHVCFLLDVGASMHFGFDGKTKYDTMRNMSLLLGSIIADRNDSCSLISYDQDIVQIQLNLTGNTIIPNVLKILDYRVPPLEKEGVRGIFEQPTHSSQLFSNLASCILDLTSCISRPTHFIIITDDQDDSYLPLIRGLRKQHEVSYILIQHSLELQGVPHLAVSDGAQIHHLDKDYPQHKHALNKHREESIKRIGGYFLQVTEQSDLQKSLLSLWR